MVRARELMKEIGYSKWDNFRHKLYKLKALVKYDNTYVIEDSIKEIKIGSGANRSVVDYMLNEKSHKALLYICGKTKLTHKGSIRSEIVISEQLKRYYENLGVSFDFQHRVGRYVYDALIGENILFEFDEPYHRICKRQIRVDSRKTLYAIKHGFTLIRATESDDVIDVIIKINNIGTNKEPNEK